MLLYTAFELKITEQDLSGKCAEIGDCFLSLRRLIAVLDFFVFILNTTLTKGFLDIRKNVFRSECLIKKKAQHKVWSLHCFISLNLAEEF